MDTDIISSQPQKPVALIVDDNWDNRHIFRLALENAGYSVIEAENGGAAFVMLEKQTFDLMILDLQMPMMFGGDLLRVVRSRNAHTTTPIIVTTAHPGLVNTEISNLTPYIVYKPFNVAEFVTLARQLQPTLPPS